VVGSLKLLPNGKFKNIPAEWRLFTRSKQGIRQTLRITEKKNVFYNYYFIRDDMDYRFL